MKLTRAAYLGCLGIVWACSSSTTPGTGTGENGSGSGTGGGGASSGSAQSGSGFGGTGSSTTGTGGSSGLGSSGVPGGSSDDGGGATSGSVTGDDGSVSSDDAGGVIGSAGSSSGSSTSGTPPADVMGCGTTKLYQVDDTNTGATGPWPVGVQTVMVSGMTGGTRPVEVWYPATFGSQSGMTQVTYDLSSWLPAGQASKIPASEDKLQACNCYRNLPIDTSHGPYPAVVFIHGTGSFRTANLSTMTQWASRGFIVVAADHAGIYLCDFLATVGGGSCKTCSGVSYPGENYGTDVGVMITAMTSSSSGPFSFLGSHVDMSRIGVSGHSAGAAAAANAASKPNVQVDMPLADLGGVVPSGSMLKSVLLMGGSTDSVVPFASDTSAYTGASAAIKRLVGITNGNHLDVTDLCMDENNEGQTGIQVAQKYDVCGASTLAGLAKCGTVMPVTAGPGIVNYATTGVLEETLHCLNRDAAFSALQTTWPQVSTYQHKP
jgi:predicted dienelactone hydrolase